MPHCLRETGRRRFAGMVLRDVHAKLCQVQIVEMFDGQDGAQAMDAGDAEAAPFHGALYCAGPAGAKCRSSARSIIGRDRPLDTDELAERVAAMMGVRLVPERGH